MDLRVRYDEEVDILTVDTGLEIAVSSGVDFGLIADFGSEEGCDVVGIELMSARKLIAPFCAVNSAGLLSSQDAETSIKTLKTNYDVKSDILSVRSTRKAEFSLEVCDGLLVFMGYEDEAYKDRYDMVGFELHNASECLAPWFKLNRNPLSSADSQSN